MPDVGCMKKKSILLAIVLSALTLARAETGYVKAVEKWRSAAAAAKRGR